MVLGQGRTASYSNKIRAIPELLQLLELRGCLVTELRLAGARGIWDANSVLEQFLLRFNQRFRVPPQHPETEFRPLRVDLTWNRSCASSTAGEWPVTTR